MWSDVAPRQLTELAGMFTAFAAAVVYGVTRIHQVDWHLWAFLAAGFYAAWVIGFHMKTSLWQNFSPGQQKWLRRGATAVLALITVAAVSSTVASATTNTAEGSPCGKSQLYLSPWCSSAGALSPWRGQTFSNVSTLTTVSSST